MKIEPIVVAGSNPIFKSGRHLAFFGRSNVGKSSTINALLGSRSAKSSTKPGKTITFNFYEYEEGKYLVDLPGYGFARHGEAFREKLRRRLLWYVEEAIGQIDKFIIVLDAKAGLTDLDQSALDLAKINNLDVIVLVNKTDKLNQSERSKLKKLIEDQIYGQVKQSIPILFYSAKTGRGVAEVVKVLGMN